ncbi:MAG: lipopolysaccharide biosynthesis protein [Paludibacteraceae bacterium]|nr:lipopolysaccharide biosynthesis protein [Paludibacteraceae bacterium]
MSNNLVSNLSWKFAERFLVQLITLVVSIIIARILSPSDFGPIVLVLSVTNLAYAIVDGGFNSALIQKKDADIVDFSTIFHFTIWFSIVLYGILYFTAPYIHSFFGSQFSQLTSILRVIGLIIPLYGINSIQQAYVARHMLFNKLFYATAIGTIISAAVGLIMAYQGFGVWALVAQIMSSTIVTTIALFAFVHKLPKWIFSYSQFKQLFKYGSRILGATLLINIYQELRTFIIGKLYTPNDLAYFDRGKQFPFVIVNNVNTSIGAVLFPKLSQSQDDTSVLRQTTRMSIRFSAYIMAPMMFGLIACADPLVRLLLTDKWVFCIPFIRIFCIVYMFQPIHTANMQAIKAIGRSDVFLTLEVIKKTLELVSLVCVMWISVKAIVWNMAILTTLFTFVNAYPNKKFLNYSYLEQVKDILPPILLAAVMAGLVYPISLLSIHTIWILCIQVVLGVVVYILFSILTQNKEYEELKTRAVALIKK